jgi:hypothetical protein
LALVSDAHVVDILDCGETAGRVPYFVMEYLIGQDLARVLDCAPLELARVLALSEGVCHGLAAVHAAGLVHRDIKPGNLFLVAEPGYRERCKLLDFGVAKLGPTSSTRGGTILGTVRYMAPEQLMDSASVGAACDVYALGAVIYHCLTGRPPHQAGSEPALMFEILNRRPALLKERRPDLPAALSELIDEALDKDPARRPGSADAFLDRLVEIRSRLAGSTGDALDTLSSEPIVPRPLAAAAVERARLHPVNSVRLAAGTLLTVFGAGMALDSALRGRSPTAETKAPRPSSVAAAASAAASARSPEPVPDGAASAPRVIAPEAPATAVATRSDAPAVRVKTRTASAAQAQPSSGTLQIGAEPTWATVTLDGKPAGSTPLIVSDVASGRHVIGAQALGDGPAQTRTVVVDAGATQRLLFHF